LMPPPLLFTPDGRTLVAPGSGARSGLAVWDWATSADVRGGPVPGIAGISEAIRRGPSGSVSSAALGPDGRTLWALGQFDGMPKGMSSVIQVHDLGPRKR